MTTVSLGDHVRDRITGMTGIVICRAEWMYGCVRLTVQPQELKDGRPVDPYTIDEPQAELIEPAVIKQPTFQPPAVRKAGPRQDVVRGGEAKR